MLEQTLWQKFHKSGNKQWNQIDSEDGKMRILYEDRCFIRENDEWNKTYRETKIWTVGRERETETET